MSYGWRYCICGRRYRQERASTTKCPECMEAVPVSNPEAPTLDPHQKIDYCRRCDGDRIHILTGPYHGKYYWKCECSLLKLADVEGFIT